MTTPQAAIRILALSGSLRQGSINTAVLSAAARLGGSDATVTIYDGLRAVPPFDPDLDGDDLPRSVSHLRDSIGRHDAILICSPEFARGVAGVLKNALDWLVSSSEFPGKPVAVINASQRATHADANLRVTLETMSARLIQPASITLPLLGRGLDADGIVTDPDLSASLRAAVAALVDAVGT